MSLRPVIVGVVNVTPDSFSDGGRFFSASDAAAQIDQLFADGADIVEIGGESTRPGAVAVDAAEERRRVVPIIADAVRRHPERRIAIDTVKAEVAEAALDAGATVVNDVSALRLDPRMGPVCAAAGCTVILMHSRGGVADMARYEHASYGRSVIEEIRDELQDAVDLALDAGVRREAIVLDPGIGFAKTPSQSLEALAHLGELADLGFPMMIGASRKRFIGELTGVATAAERDAGTVGVDVVALTLGASWFRVHDVRANRHALDAAAAVLGVRPGARA